MTPMIRTIQIHTIPTRRERNHRPYPPLAKPAGEFVSIRRTAVDRVAGFAGEWHAAVTDFAARGCCGRERGGRGVAGEHAEAWAECGDGRFVEDVWDVVHCDSSIAR
jgi:hypothetical protein